MLGSRLRKLTIVFHHAGGGHRSTADALKAALSAQREPWDVTLLNIQELLSPLDLLRSLSFQPFIHSLVGSFSGFETSPF